MEEKTPQVVPHRITLKEIKDNSYQLEDDSLGIASYVLTPERMKVSLENPVREDDDSFVFNFMVVDGIIAGRSQRIATQIKVGDSIYRCESGSSLEVDEQYRKFGIGADIMMMSLDSKYKMAIAAGITDVALPLYKALKYNILEFPIGMCFRDSRSVLAHFGLGGLLLKLATGIVNLPLKCWTRKSLNASKKLMRKFKVVKERIVPEWIDGITLNDGHKYMEVHDHKWMQWNLDNHFHSHERNTQAFYGIYNGTKPLGFFLINERYSEGLSLKNVMRGAIMEWGTLNPDVLSETDIYTIALGKFSKDVAIISIATDDMKTLKYMKRFGFLPHGTTQIVFRAKGKEFKDASDINLWRIRYAYADTFLS